MEKEEDASGTAKKKSRTTTTTKQKGPQTAPRENVVYLTADASDELTELKEDETYIIGGIVDHNRYKVRFLLLCQPHFLTSFPPALLLLL